MSEFTTTYISPPRHISYKCAFPLCSSVYYKRETNNKSFFYFPKKEHERKQWFDAVNAHLVNKIQYHATAWKRLCQDHFAERQFANFQKRRLNSFTVPTIFATDPALIQSQSPNVEVEDNSSESPEGNFQIWVERTGNEKLYNLNEEQIYNGAKVCGSHFNDSCRLDGKVGLKKGSLPTLYLPSANRLSIGSEVQIGDGEDLIKEKENEVKAIIQNLNNNLTVDNVEIQNQFTLGQQEIIIITHNDKNKPNVSVPVQPAAVKFNVNQRSCQICLVAKEDKVLSRLDDIKLCNNTETVKEMLKVVIPEFDLTKYPDSEICTSCKDLVIASFELKQIWKATEAKLNNIVKTYERKQRVQSILKQLDDEVIAERAAARMNKSIPAEIEDDPFEEGPITIEDSDDETIKYYDHDYVQDFHLLVKKPMISPKKKEKVFDGSILCEQCGITLLNKRRMVRHLKLYHLDLMCESCGEAFDNYITLNKHIRTEHATAKRKLKVKAAPSKSQCHICAKVFANVRSLKTHVLHVHFKKYNYAQCHICGKTLSEKTALRAHLKVHSAHKPYRCDICSKTFLFSSHLRKHKRSHLNTVHFCNICGKKVKHMHSLEKHIKVFHLREGECTCDICGRPYWKKFDLQRHKVRIHGWHPSQDKQEEDSSI